MKINNGVTSFIGEHSLLVKNSNGISDEYDLNKAKEFLRTLKIWY